MLFPPMQPAPPQKRLRIGVFPSLDSPQAAFTDGDLLTCDFAVAADATIGARVDLTAVEPVQVVRSDLSVVCGPGSMPMVDCGTQDGAVFVGEAPTPTPTDTPEVSPTDTPEVSPTDTPEVSPTDTPEVSPTDTPEVSPTDTPEVSPTDTPEVSPTDTPEVSPTDTPEVSPTDTPEVSPTDTPEVGPTDTPEVGPTNTPVRPTATASPKKSGDDDGCAIVPAQQSRPFRALVLLIGPALLLWGRRRRF
ncbi:MAG: hypothetical protein WB819_11005 [Terriglobia bacterium]